MPNMRRLATFPIGGVTMRGRGMAGAVVSCPPAILPIFRSPRVNVRAHRALRATSPSPEPVLAVRARWGWRQSAFRTSKTATGRFGPHPAARSFLAVLGRFSGLCGRLVCARFGFAAWPRDGGKLDHPLKGKATTPRWGTAEVAHDVGVRPAAFPMTKDSIAKTSSTAINCRTRGLEGRHGTLPVTHIFRCSREGYVLRTCSFERYDGNK
jgi:hypothetical protein